MLTHPGQELYALGILCDNEGAEGTSVVEESPPAFVIRPGRSRRPRHSVPGKLPVDGSFYIRNSDTIVAANMPLSYQSPIQHRPAPVLLITIPRNSRYHLSRQLFQQRRLFQSPPIPFRPLMPKTGCSSTPPTQSSSSNSTPRPPRRRPPSQRPGSYWATTRNRPISPTSTLENSLFERGSGRDGLVLTFFLKNLSLVFWGRITLRESARDIEEEPQGKEKERSKKRNRNKI